MRISVSEAKAQLTELMRTAESGDEVVLTRHGHAVAHLVPINALSDGAPRRRLLEAARATASSKAFPGPPAARSQDFLYGDDGIPE